MIMPKQSPPVLRPEVIQPHRTVDVVNGTPEQLILIRIKLLTGANYNDPQHVMLAGFDRLRLSARGRR